MSKIKQVDKIPSLPTVVSSDRVKGEEKPKILSLTNPFSVTLHPFLIWVEKEIDR